MGYLKMPIITEVTSRGERSFDIYSRLLRDRIIFFTGEVDDEIADSLIAQLFYLESEDPKADINLFLNSPGGSVTAGLAIYDAMQFVSCDVSTYCFGLAASMGAVLLSAGKKGKRFSLPNARIMIHQPSGLTYGKAIDMEIQVKETNLLKKRLNEILAFHTGQSFEVIQKDTDRDFFMSAEEAVKYGLVDKVIASRNS